MPEPISLKINTSLIDQSKLFKGAKGTYLDAVLLPSQNSQYGDDYMIVQSVTREEREKGIRGAILGNAKILRKQRAAATPEPKQDDLGGPDDVPF